MTTQEIKAEMKKTMSIISHNYRIIKHQLNSAELKQLKEKHNPEDDRHLAKLLAFNGIAL